jgi:hypothetical protein
VASRGAQLDVTSKGFIIKRTGSALDCDMARLQHQPGDDAVVAAAGKQGGKDPSGDRDYLADYCPAKAGPTQFMAFGLRRPIQMMGRV